jgi:hypothetical protein
MSSVPRWIAAQQPKLLKCGRSEKVTTRPQNLNLGKSLTTVAIVLEKKILHE